MPNDLPFKLTRCIIRPDDYSIEFPNGQIRILQPKFISVLAYLASKHPNLVTREELIYNVWDGNFPVGEKALTNAIWNLRNEFKDFDKIQLETVRKKGYRLLTEPEYLDENPGLDQTDQIDELKSQRVNRNKSMVAAFFSVMLMAFSGYFFSSTNEEKSPAIINVTSEPGREVYPAVSPDSRYVAFSWRHITEAPNLYMKDLHDNTSAIHQLTHTENYEGRAVWHPNSEVVYFQRKRWDFEHCDVVELTLETKAERVLASCNAELDFSLAISPDGSLLAWTDTKYEYNQLNVKVINTQAPNAQPTFLPCEANCAYQELDLSFSPDGKKLLLSRTLSGGLTEDIYIYEFANQSLTHLIEISGSVRGLAWHPNGKQIVYGAEVSGKRNGFIYSFDDKQSRSLNISGFSFPNFIFGTKDAVYHSRESIMKLSTLDLAEPSGAALFPLIHSNHVYKDPHYNEKKKSIVFVSSESGNSEVWSARVDGSNRKQLTHSNHQVSSPRWSHNGQYVAFLAANKQSKKGMLYILDTKTQAITQIDGVFDEFLRPSWLRDDSGLIAGAKKDGKLSLYGFPLNKEDAYLIIDEAVTYAEQSKTGVIWFSKGRNSGLWRYSPSVNEGRPQQVLSNDDFQVSYHWELTDSGVFYQHDHVNYHQIKYFDIKSQQVTPLVKLPFGTISRKSSIAYIPSTNQLVLTEQEYPNTDIKIVQHPLFN